ncbi:hypothetical protein AMTRI_Chr06g173240 [Amborella trichopoda]
MYKSLCPLVQRESRSLVANAFSTLSNQKSTLNRLTKLRSKAELRDAKTHAFASLFGEGIWVIRSLSRGLLCQRRRISYLPHSKYFLVTNVVLPVKTNRSSLSLSPFSIYGRIHRS